MTEYSYSLGIQKGEYNEETPGYPSRMYRQSVQTDAQSVQKSGVHPHCPGISGTRPISLLIANPCRYITRADTNQTKETKP